MGNIFGGGNKNSLYTPMSEDEREVLQRLVDSDDMEIVIRGWGIVNKFKSVKFGDLRLQIIFSVHFNSPTIHMPVDHFDLQLRTRSGIELFSETQFIPTTMIGDGVVLDLAWDIAIRSMSPEVVKAIKPGARGLTTREGNRHLDPQSQKILNALRRSEEINKMMKGK